jgi:transposase
MLRALLDGVSTPQEMAALAKGSLRKKMAALAAALEGRVEDRHRFLLGMQLDRLEQVETGIQSLIRASMISCCRTSRSALS